MTVRDSPEQWFASQFSTLIPWLERAPALSLYERWTDPVAASRERFTANVVARHPMFQALMHDREHGTTTAMDWYKGWIEEVRGLVPEERLLVMNVKEGWDPLCRFLGEEIPPYPFPRKNDTATFQKNTDDLLSMMKSSQRSGTLKASALGAALLAMCIAFTYQYRLLRPWG